MSNATVSTGTRLPRSTSSLAGATGRRPRSRGASGASPSRRCISCPQTSAAWTSSSWAAARAYVSAWLARRGAQPVGIDNSPKQLEAARGFQQEFGIDFPLMLGNAETVPLPDASFDLAVSEYGAALWADPYKWIPEAARLLRPGGRLAFMSNSDMVMMCVPELETDGPATDRLLRPYFDMYRIEWPDSTGVEFHLPHGEMIRLLRSQWLRGRGAGRVPTAGGRDDALRLGDGRVGAPVAQRRRLEGGQAVTRVGTSGRSATAGLSPRTKVSRVCQWPPRTPSPRRGAGNEQSRQRPRPGASR